MVSAVVTSGQVAGPCDVDTPTEDEHQLIINPDVIDEVDLNKNDDVTKDVVKYCASRERCQLLASERCVDEISIPIVERADQEQAISRMPCDVDDVSVLNVDTCSINVGNDVDVGRVVVLEPDSYHSTPTLPSEIIPRDKLAYLSSLPSRQLLAVLYDYPDVYIDRTDLCNIVRHTVEFSIDHSTVQRAPPGCDNQSTVGWACRYNERVVCLPTAPTINAPNTVDAGCQSDHRWADSERCRNKSALWMGWSSVTIFTCHHYFARAKRKETQQSWAVITLEVYAGLGRVQIVVRLLFGTGVTVYPDHKLVRWSLVIAECNVVFRYRRGIENEAADCMSRMVYSLKN